MLLPRVDLPACRRNTVKSTPLQATISNKKNIDETTTTRNSTTLLNIFTALFLNTRIYLRKTVSSLFPAPPEPFFTLFKPERLRSQQSNDQHLFALSSWNPELSERGIYFLTLTSHKDGKGQKRNTLKITKGFYQGQQAKQGLKTTFFTKYLELKPDFLPEKTKGSE